MNNKASLRPKLNLPKQINILYYRSKKPGLLEKYKNYKTSRQIIEIVPYDKQCFDPISFIEFATALNKKFCVINEMSTISNTKNAHINVFKRKNICTSKIEENDNDDIQYISHFELHVLLSQA